MLYNVERLKNSDGIHERKENQKNYGKHTRKRYNKNDNERIRKRILRKNNVRSNSIKNRAEVFAPQARLVRLPKKAACTIKRRFADAVRRITGVQGCAPVIAQRSGRNERGSRRTATQARAKSGLRILTGRKRNERQSSI